LKLLNVSNEQTGVILLLALIVAPVMWMVVRRRYGFPALASSVPSDSKAGRRVQPGVSRQP
jgi:hypothetical protein